MKDNILALIQEYLARPDVQQDRTAFLVLNALAGDIQVLSTPAQGLSELVDKITPENLHPEQGKETTQIDDLRAHLAQALRQWRMYANDNDGRALETCPSEEGQIYRAGVAASESTSKEKS